MKYRNIVVSTHDQAGLIKFNRPTALNALCHELVVELGQAIDAYESDPAVGAIVLTGDDKAFAAGADIKEMQHKSYMEAYLGNFITDAWERVDSCRKPVIAAVAGYALGGGCEVAMMCDFILAADNARFGQPEINIGVIPGAGGTQRLTRFIGKSKAMEMCLSGRMMDAAEAERCGLVSRVVPLAELLDEALKTANAIAGKSRPATMIAKEAVQARLRINAARGRAFRAPHVPFVVRDRGPERGHGGLRREAQATVEASLGAAQAVDTRCCRSVARHRPPTSNNRYKPRCKPGAN